MNIAETEDYEYSYQASSSTNEDNAINRDNHRLVSQYDDIDDDGVLTLSNTDEDHLFDKERKRKTMPDVYDPRVYHVTFKFKVM